MIPDGLADAARELTAGLLRGPADDRGTACSECFDPASTSPKDLSEDDLMQPTRTWSPALCAYVDAWECPHCGRQVMREGADGEVGLTAPDGERL